MSDELACNYIRSCLKSYEVKPNNGPLFCFLLVSFFCVGLCFVGFWVRYLFSMCLFFTHVALVLAPKGHQEQSSYRVGNNNDPNLPLNRA